MPDNSRIIDAILEREGSELVQDWKGASRWGITINTLSDWLARRVNSLVLQELPQSTAREIYASMFIEKPGYNRLEDEQIRGHVVDCAVLHGPRNATTMLQLAANSFVVGTLVVDGICGPKTAAIVNDFQYLASLNTALVSERVRFIGRLLSENYRDRRNGHTRADASEYASGWINRSTEFLL